MVEVADVTGELEVDEPEGIFEGFEAGVDLPRGHGIAGGVGFQERVDIGGLLDLEREGGAGAMRDGGRDEESLLVVLIENGGEFEGVLGAFVDGGEKFFWRDAGVEADVGVGLGAFGLRGAWGFEEVVGFVLAEAVAAEVAGGALDLGVAGVEVEDDGLAGVEDFDEAAEFGAVFAEKLFAEEIGGAPEGMARGREASACRQSWRGRRRA